MSRTLLLGCSHTAGSYTKDNDLEEYFPGYATYLSAKFDSEWKMYSFPGDGIMMYASILTYLENCGKLDSFDNLIIQFSSELRINGYSNWQAVIDHIESDIDKRNLNDSVCVYDDKDFRGERMFTTNAASLYEIYESRFNKEKLEWLTVADEATWHISRFNRTDSFGRLVAQSLYQGIKDLCVRNNIILYSFGWSYTTPFDFEPYKSLELDDPPYIFDKDSDTVQILISELYGEDFWKDNMTNVGEHSTRELAKPIAKLLYEYLIKKGYKG